MKLFLASNIGGIKKENGKRIPVKFFENNLVTPIDNRMTM